MKPLEFTIIGVTVFGMSRLFDGLSNFARSAGLHYSAETTNYIGIASLVCIGAYVLGDVIVTLLAKQPEQKSTALMEVPYATIAR